MVVVKFQNTRQIVEKYLGSEPLEKCREEEGQRAVNDGRGKNKALE